MAVGPNVFFDPSREELAVADVVLSLTFAAPAPLSRPPAAASKGFLKLRPGANLLAVRMVEPPGRRLTAVVGTVVVEGQDEAGAGGEGVWKKRAGGVGREVLRRMVDMVIRKGGVGEEVLAALEGWA